MQVSIKRLRQSEKRGTNYFNYFVLNFLREDGK